MEIELQSLCPISPPETEPESIIRENGNSELQPLITDGTEALHQNNSETYYSLQEIITETPNQRSETTGEVVSEELWTDALYNAVIESDVMKVANLMKFSDDFKAEFTKKTFPHIFEERDIGNVREEPATPDDVNREFPFQTTDLSCFGINDIEENATWSILHLASSYASEKVVSLLLLAGADPLARDTFGRTALDVTGCNLHVPQDWDNILGLGKIHEWSRVIKALLLAGVPFNIRACLRTDTRFYSLLLAEIIDTGRNDLGLVKELLDAGAMEDPSDYTTWEVINQFVEKQAKEEWQLLLSNYEDNTHASIALQTAVTHSWTDGVRLSLLAGANVVERNFPLRQINLHNNFHIGKKTAFHLAARMGNIDILKLILAVAKFKTTQNENYDELCQSFPDVPESLESRRKYFEKLHQYTVSFTDLINLKDGFNNSSLYYTVQYTRLECLNILLENDALLFCAEGTLLHLAVNQSDIDIARRLIDHDESLVQATDELGREPLHIACDCGHKQMIFLLVRNGSDLSKKDKLGVTPIQIINDNFTNPNAFIKELFDSSITCEHIITQSTNKYQVDFRIITPKDKEQEFDVIQNLVTVEQAELLTHPLIESFIYLEWNSFVYLYWVVIAIHVTFVLALNLYIVPLYYYRDKKEELPMYFSSTFWLCVIYIAAVLYVVDNIFSMQEMCRVYTHRFIVPFRVWKKLATTLLYVCLPIALLWETTATSEAGRFLATLAVLISLFDILCLISIITFDWGFHVQIIGTVAWKILKLFLIFGLIIVGFSLVFMIQFRGQEPFTNPLTAFMKTFAMTNTEYEYSSTYNATNVSELTMSTFIQNITFVAFIVLVPLVCFALVNSYAVNDLENLEKTGNITILKKQAAFLASMENNVCKRYLKKKMISLFSNWRRRDILLETTRFSNGRMENYLTAYPVLPKRIKQSIILNVQARLELLERERKTDKINLNARPSAFSKFEVVIWGERRIKVNKNVN